MKLLFSFLTAAAMLFFLSPSAVRAEETARYARILDEEVYFYERAEAESGLFVLPRTYFVRITGEEGNYYAAEYRTGSAALQGYCLKSQVELVDYVPETPYLLYDTEVTFTVGSADLPDGFFTEYTVSAAFYGTFYYGSSVFYYVNLGGEFGYVPAGACPPLDYPENTEHMQAETPETPQESGGNANVVNIILICALSVAGIGAVYFLFRPAKPPRPQTYGEDAEDPF